MKALTVNQLMKLSNILKLMGFKEKLTDVIFGKKFDEELKAMGTNSIEKKDMIMINIVSFFIENMYLAKDEIIELISEVENKEIDIVGNYTVDQYLNSIEKILYCSLPINYRIIAINLVDTYKKKVSTRLKDSK